MIVQSSIRSVECIMGVNWKAALSRLEKDNLEKAWQVSDRTGRGETLGRTPDSSPLNRCLKASH